MDSSDQQKIAAFLKAEYVVYTDQLSNQFKEVALHVGEPSAFIKYHLNALNSLGCAYITANNPNSQPATSDAVNANLNQQLKKALSPGWRYFEGQGRDPQAKWPAEESFLVFNITRQQTAELMHRFEQLGFLYADQSAIPQLWFRSRNMENRDQDDLLGYQRIGSLSSF